MAATPATALRWSFPFKTADDKAFLDPRRLQAALSHVRGGTYPIGRNGTWHGGIHFDEGTQAAFDQSSVRCIADGEVIAYRIDQRYPRTCYGSGVHQQEAVFSTGFVLVRHRLQMPAVPGAESPTLTLFSLYMHLQDWASYEAAPNQERPAFWHGVEPRYRVKADVHDLLAGLSVRETPSGRVLGRLPRGSRLTLGTAQQGWASVLGGPDVPAELVGGWVERALLIPLGNGHYRIGNQAAEPLQPRRYGLNLRSRDGQILALLSPGATLSLQPQASHSRYHLVTAILSGETLPSRTAEDTPRGYIWRDSLEPLTQPQAFDDVVVLDTPCPIKAGDLIGHLGQYQHNGEGRPQRLLHLEVFSCDDVPAFIAHCQRMADRLDPDARTLLKVAKATPLFKHLDTQTGRPAAVGNDQLVQHDTLLPIALLQALPDDKRQLTRLNDEDIHWWWLDDLPGPDETLISGWFRESPDDLVRYTPWHWEGFQTLTETRGYTAQLEKEEGPLSEYLYGLLDTDRDARLSDAEIRTALAKPWLFDPLSRLITRYESEWYADAGMSKWNALDDWIGEGGLEDWRREKDRISKLTFWSKIPEINAKHGHAYHFHPLKLIENMNHKQCCILTKDNFQLIFGRPRLFAARHMNPQSTAYNIPIDRFVAMLNEAFEKYNFKKCLHKAHFLAQCFHESDNFRTIEEYADGSSYEIANFPEEVCSLYGENGRPCRRRRQIIAEGNTLPGDGAKYKGRGLIQLTWKSSYIKYGQTKGLDLEKNPELLSNDIELAIDASFWFWNTSKGYSINDRIDLFEKEAIKQFSDVRSQDDEIVRKVTRIVNGGENHLKERQSIYQKIKEHIK